MRALDSNRHRIAKQSGVTGSELRALSRVAEAGGITPKDLADSLEMTTGAVTAISNRLVRSGLLRRVDHPSDRRSVFLELTPSGDDLMQSIYVEFDEALAASALGVVGGDPRSCGAVMLAVADRLMPAAPSAD
jgi:DNA-binding MarR family transcriptional regulator